MEEAKEAHLTIDDLDLDKVWQELSPFIQYVSPAIKEACKILAKDDKALEQLTIAANASTLLDIKQYFATTQSIVVGGNVPQIDAQISGITIQ